MENISAGESEMKRVSFSASAFQEKWAGCEEGGVNSQNCVWKSQGGPILVDSRFLPLSESGPIAVLTLQIGLRTDLVSPDLSLVYFKWTKNENEKSHNRI